MKTPLSVSSSFFTLSPSPQLPMLLPSSIRPCSQWPTPLLQQPLPMAPRPAPLADTTSAKRKDTHTRPSHSVGQEGSRLRSSAIHPTPQPASALAQLLNRAPPHCSSSHPHARPRHHASSSNCYHLGQNGRKPRTEEKNMRRGWTRTLVSRKAWGQHL